MTSIVVATDGSSSGENAVQVAADIAKARSANVVVLSVIDNKPVPDSVRAMAKAEHLVGGEKLSAETSLLNVPTWMMKDLHAAAQADENVRLRTVVADLAVKKAHKILKAAGVTAVTEVEENGNVADAIVTVADRVGADMIVMGSRGLGTLQSLVYGSTSRDVAKRAKCSCIAVT